MVLLGVDPAFTKVDYTKDTKKARPLPKYIIPLIAIIMAATSDRFLIAVPGLLLPCLFFKYQDLKFISVLLAVLFLKILFSALMDPGPEYSHYIQDDFWLIREPATIFLFFAWFLFGYRNLTISQINQLSSVNMLLLMPILYLPGFLFSNTIALSTISNAQAIIWLFFFSLLNTNRPKLAQYMTLGLIIVTGVLPMDSSFTIIASVAMFITFMLNLLKLEKVKLNWRLIAILLVVILLFTSLFAYLFHFREDRANGEGNNGYTRATLAEAGFIQFANDPFLGSPYGRGILPMSVIEKLGWTQYFEAGSELNIYNLSFHNSFIYCLTRYGLLSIVLFYLILCRVPRHGPINAVLFMFVLFIAMGANVVIESLRSGPGVGLALGVLFSTILEPKKTSVVSGYWGKNNSLVKTVSKRPIRKYKTS